MLIFGGQVGELADGAGVGVGFVDGGGVGGGIELGVEDAVGFVAGDESVRIATGSGSATALGSADSAAVAAGGLGTSRRVLRVSMSRTWMPSGAV